MYLKSVDGKIIFEGRFSSIRQGVEMAVENKVDLSGVNLRQANLAGGNIDGAQMAGACLWGANLTGVDMSGGNYAGCDFRTAHLVDSCLAEADCSGANFRGSYFSRTIFRGADLSVAEFSCPSVFTLDLAEAKSLEGAIYSHMGEIDCDLSHAPLVIRGLYRPLIFMDDSVLVGGDLVKVALRKQLLHDLLARISAQDIL